MRELVYSTNTEFAKKFGNHNQAPPNLKEIKEDYFFNQFLTFPPDYTMYKQVHGHPSFDYLPLHMYIYSDGSGVAIGEVNSGRVYFQFATCQHQYENVAEESRMCYHVSKCKLCGYKQAIDSSD